ncbi:hypothetical protein CKO27_23750 [Thiocystis violacea]|nr:hypothetical protein [Thiocystis violacea]
MSLVFLGFIIYVVVRSEVVRVAVIVLVVIFLLQDQPLLGLLVGFGIAVFYPVARHYIFGKKGKISFRESLIIRQQEFNEKLAEKYREELNIQSITEKHLEALARKKRQLSLADDYGNPESVI